MAWVPVPDNAEVGPASDIRLAILEPIFPKLAKKMSRFIGLLKCDENMNVVITKKIPTSETQEPTLSVMTIALSWPGDGAGSDNTMIAN